jgi:ubiquinone/menaquinone biosynthesis C-methylase UbiE
MELSKKELNKLIIGMKQAYSEGKNAMDFARSILNKYSVSNNHKMAILIAYDLQAGTYVEVARKNYDFTKSWCRQLAGLINPIFPNQEGGGGGSILEVGVGEATTLKGVIEILGKKVNSAFGFDISWSRIIVGNEYLSDNSIKAKLFVADLSNIPLPDNSIDIVYSSHSLEPNRGLEEKIIIECMRVARKAVVLVEPIYELASREAQVRMDNHGYAKGLYQIAKRLNFEILDYRLLKYTSNLLNPSGVLSLKKKKLNALTSAKSPKIVLDNEFFWICPLTGSQLFLDEENYLRSDIGIAYPIMSGVPLLRSEHAIISSKFLRKIK